MATSTAADSLVEELMGVEGKAEIVNGEIQHQMATGGKPGRAAKRILLALAMYEETANGEAFGDNIGFLCDLPNRQSFSPDAAFYVGPDAETELGFMPIPPVFAVEVRSENDYGPKAERDMAQKRADYFAAGTLVVWDVDLLSEEVVRCYTAQNLKAPQFFRRGDEADAEPAVPSWKMPVDALFLPTRTGNLK